jgi:hypothetical protein
MHVLWGVLIVVAGLFMFVCGSLKSTFIIYRLMVARSRMLWSENVHRFYQIAGAIVVIFGLLVALGYIGRKEQPKTPETPARPPRVNLHDAAWEGNLEAVKQHIMAGSDLNEKTAAGTTPLERAVAADHTKVVKVLIDAGANVNCTNNEGSTPLHTAAFLCRTDIVKILLENGADRDARNNAGVTAFESVAGPFDDVKGIYDILDAILAQGGVRLDYERIIATRPQIAEMLRQ